MAKSAEARAAEAPEVSRPCASNVTLVYVPAVPVFFRVVATDPEVVVISPVRAGKWLCANKFLE